MILNLIQPNIQFSTLYDRSTTKRIVIHHSDADPATPIETIHGWHKNLGWAGIGYHYYIPADGAVYVGRPDGKRGAHAYQDATHEANTDGIGVCVGGRFELTSPSDTQLNTLVELCRELQKKYGALEIVKHSEVCATACPGSLFPWDKFKAMLSGEAPATQDDLIAWAMSKGLIAEAHKLDEVVTMETLLTILKNDKGE